MATFSTAQEWELLSFTGTTSTGAQTVIGGPASGLFDTVSGYQHMLVSARTFATSGSLTNVGAAIVIAENIGPGTTQYLPTQTYDLTWQRNTGTNNRASGIFQYNMNDGSALQVTSGTPSLLAAGAHCNHIPYGFHLSIEITGGVSTTWNVLVARYK